MLFCYLVWFSGVEVILVEKWAQISSQTIYLKEKAPQVLGVSIT